MAARVRRVLRHLRSRRFQVAVVGVVGLLGAIVADGWLRWVLGLAGAAALLIFFLVLSVRLADLQRRVAPAAGGREAEASSARLADTISILGPAGRAGAMATAELGSPIVTVVIPCYNDERFVAEAIESVRRQSLEDWECIVVDDASTDQSIRTIWKATRRDERFRVLRHRVNGGLAAARNTGLRAARGTFVTFLDSDDLLMADSLLDRVIALTQAMGDPHVIASYGGMRIGLEDTSLDDLPPRDGKHRGRIVDFIAAGGECPFNAHAPLLQTDLVRRIGGFDERMRQGAEDWDLWYRILRNGYAFVPASSITAVYRQRKNSMVRALPDAHMAEADRLISAAFRAADPSVFTLPSPTPFTEPLGTYLEQLRKSERAIQFAAMALVRGDEAAARRTLSAHRHLPLPVLGRHLDVGGLTERGMRRALGVRHDELKQFGTSLSHAADRLRALVAETAGPAASVTQAPGPPDLDCVLVPQHAGQLGPMLDLARERGIERSRLAVVDISREAGDQGVTAEIPDDVASLSLNAWLLLGHRARTVMVGSVRVAAADQLARQIVADGAEAVEVPQPLSEVMSIEAAGRTRIEADHVSSLFGRPSRAEAPLEIEPAAAWALEEDPDTIVDAEKLAEFRDRHRGERVVIIGNGPSLNECDLTKLKGEYTIAVNGIFYAADRMGFDPSYYVVEDTAVMSDNVEAIKAYQAGHKFFPSIYRKFVGDAPNVTYFMMNRGFYRPASPDFCIPKFSLNPEQRLYSGQSVTIINLQLAYFMGFSEVALIGMDFSYTVPDTAEVKGDLITSRGDDPNHFHPDYFGAGKVWKDPKLDRVLANYALAKQIFEADGRRIVNATKGGNLHLFERKDYDTYFG